MRPGSWQDADGDWNSACASCGAGHLASDGFAAINKAAACCAGKVADPVSSPAHYTAGGIETIDFIEAKGLGFHLGNVVKYVVRADLKGKPVEDLEKARWYLDREIARRKAGR